MENQTGKRIKCVRIDNGGEFCSIEFEQFYKEQGIERHKTTPYTLQKNGVVERMNRTLMKKARSMLSGASLEQRFWAEAMATTCYLVNRSPTSALVGKTPMEVWSGKKPSIRNLHVFGCEAYAHIPKVKRSKLEIKVVKFIFIGYSVGVKGYKLWDLVTSKVLHTRNVIFRELTSSPIVLQPNEKEKEKDVVQLPPTPEKNEQRDRDGSDDEESSSSSENLEEEVKQPQPQPLRRFMR